MTNRKWPQHTDMPAEPAGSSSIFEVHMHNKSVHLVVLLIRGHCFPLLGAALGVVLLRISHLVFKSAHVCASHVTI